MLRSGQHDVYENNGMLFCVPTGSMPPLLRGDEMLDVEADMRYDSFAKVFDLGDDDQRKAYEAVLTSAANGKAIMSEDSRVDFHDGKYTAFLQWSEPYHLLEIKSKAGDVL